MPLGYGFVVFQAQSQRVRSFGMTRLLNQGYDGYDSNPRVKSNTGVLTIHVGGAFAGTAQEPSRRTLKCHEPDLIEQKEVYLVYAWKSSRPSLKWEPSGVV